LGFKLLQPLYMPTLLLIFVEIGGMERFDAWGLVLVTYVLTCA
jgi:hypothetical protein